MKKDLCYLVTTLLLFLMPAFLFGQAPNLGAASGFALFTGTGAAFTNLGDATSVTGDVGANTGTHSAFPTGTLVGNTHWADGTSATVAADVITAYSDLNAVVCGTALGTPFGSGSTLTQGVYCTVDAAVLNGDLTLDGGGDPNALFIFKINGALSTGSSSNVILTNSASLCNVYWQVVGAFSLGDGSVFRGTVIASGAISLLEGSFLQGRGLSTAGSIDLHNNIVTIPSVGSPVFALGAISNRCQEAGTVTYTATATNNTGITYSLDATTAAFFGNGIVAATGVVTYAVGWSGTTTITASAAGCGGTKTAIHTVTVYPSSLTSAIYHQ